MNINKILEDMTLDEKISLFCGKSIWETVDLPQHGVPSIFLADGPCGLRKQEQQGDHLGIFDSIPATATVSGGSLAATWNPDCAKMNGKILGEEAAEANVDVLLGPAMNIVRSPLCGRNFEYFSEDPYLTGEIAAAYVEGVQESGTGACLKHFAVNNQETEREYINAIVDERTLREIYLVGFEKAVKQARPQSVMSALNQINGVYGAENKYLLTDILRNEWGFDGFTVSDWFGIVHPGKAVAAGMDLDMPYNEGVGALKIKKALDEGTLTEEEVDAGCLRLLNAVAVCMERRKTKNQKTKAELHDEHHELTRKIAEEGIVLLKNENNILPISEKDKVAVIGYYAKEARITLDGSARVIKTRQDNPLEFIHSMGGDNVSYAQGYAENPSDDNENLINEAIELARNSEKVLFFMGQPPGVESEGHDRKHIHLPTNQELLLERILDINPSVVVILSNASAVAMPWENRVNGIFECFFAGQAFGSAIANLLYGKVNPSGKLPVSFTKRLEDTSAYLSFPGNKIEVIYSEGVFVGYRYYDLKQTDLLFPFGFGLSYTTFSYSDLKLDKDIFDKGDLQVSVSVKIKNVGNCDGAEVVQLYVGMFDDVVKRPEKELKGFRKVFLKVGEEKQVTFTLSKRDFAFYYERYQEWYTPEGEYQIMVGASCADIQLKKMLTVIPDKAHLKPLSGWSKVEQLRQTPKGEATFQEIKKYLLEHLTEDSVFLEKSKLEVEDGMDSIPLRFYNLITYGVIDNDWLLARLEEINLER